MKSPLTIPVAIIVGAIIVAVAVFISMPKGSGSETSAGNPALVRPVSTSDHILGNPAAPVVIVEYSDFDCEFCKDFHNTLNQVIANAGTNGKVAWIFRHFPLTEIHPNALAHARAVECVSATAGNEAFWEFSNALFANQPINPQNYGTLASSIGIYGDAFATCYSMASSTLNTRIAADRQNALDIGAQGTPYSLILVAGKNPVVMIGVYSYDAVKQLVDQALTQ